MNTARPLVILSILLLLFSSFTSLSFCQNTSSSSGDVQNEFNSTEISYEYNSETPIHGAPINDYYANAINAQYYFINDTTAKVIIEYSFTLKDHQLEVTPACPYSYTIYFYTTSGISDDSPIQQISPPITEEQHTMDLINPPTNSTVQITFLFQGVNNTILERNQVAQINISTVVKFDFYDFNCSYNSRTKGDTQYFSMLALLSTQQTGGTNVDVNQPLVIGLVVGLVGGAIVFIIIVIIATIVGAIVFKKRRKKQVIQF
eukprot:TRINITY_DN1763_c0_g2_i1.p1 TRINITY_DN1763_c0_g2~~TRINITY_DN1763_c0_g2_i1.p1  ORF type:complete len:260 (+),score=48.28 TRINITY_DN1763_c0_g2_i1:44-823(+)